MGYRSTVAIILPNHIYQNLLDTVAVFQDYDTKRDVYLLLNDAKILQHNETKDVLLTWTNICWYSDDADCRDIFFVDNFLKELPDNDYIFLRVGEDIDDYSIFGDYYYPFDAYIEHNIHLDTDNCTRITVEQGAV